MSKPGSGFRPDESWLAFTVHRPVAILMVVLAVGVFGWVSYNRLALTLMPDMSYPTLSVRTEYPGTAPEEIENVISRPLEQELGIIPRLASISSVSKAGQSDVILEFQWDSDIAAVAQTIREKIDRLRLPDGVQRPLLLHYDPSLDPILRIGLAGPQSLYELRHLAEYEIKRRLEGLDGVAAIRIKGGLEEEFLIAIDEGKLSTLRLDIGQIGQRLQQGNVNLPGGNLREGQTEYLIRTLNEFRTMEEIGALIVSRQDSVDVRLRDIATISRFHKDRDVITRVNGEESVEIEVYKEAAANVVAVATTVKDALLGRADQQAYIANLSQPPPPAAERVAAGGKRSAGKAKAKGKAIFEERQLEAQQAILKARMTDFLAYQLPPGASLQVLSDQSVFISNSIAEVKNNAVFGALIAVFVLYLFLRNVAHTVIIGLCIPISIVATFAPMFMTGVSLNMISLGGLALGVGMLVDNAIVVLESIFRCREEGDDLRTAVVRGTSEVGMAVVASTLTTVAVFFPIVFVEGVAGQVFGDMALTVVFSLLASLGAALFFIPMLASRQFGAGLQAPTGSDTGYMQFPQANGALRTVALVGGFVLGRIALALLMIFAAVVKAILVLPIVAVVQAVLLTEKFAGLVAGRWSAGLARWAVADGLWGLKGSAVWPGLLAFSAPAALATDGRVLIGWLSRRPRWALVLKLAPALVALAFLIARSVIATALRMVGTVLQTAALMLFVVVSGLFRLAAGLLGPVSNGGLTAFENGFRLLQNLYPRVIGLSLRHRVVVIGGAFATFALCALFVFPRLGRELIPAVHQGEFNLDVTLPIGTPLERTAAVTGRIEDAVLLHPEVERTALTVGAEDAVTTSSEAGEHTARLTVRLKPGTTSVEEQALIDRLRAELSDVPEISTEVTHPALFSFKAPIEVEIRGHDLTALKRLSQEAVQRLAEIPGLVDLRSTLQTGHPEIQIVYYRDRLAEYGLNLRTVADLVRAKVQGRVATEFRQPDRMIDIVVRLREEDRLGIEELRRLVVNPGAAVTIPLAAVAELTVDEGPSEIRRVDQQRAALIIANVDGVDLATMSREIVATMAEISFPPGFAFVVAGQNEEMKTSLDSLLLAFALALFLVYIVMASQFESLVQPLLIMMTVPLALIGVTLALWVGGISISIMVFLGLIILAGIVVNNAIVLVDYINTLRARGIEKTTAIVEAGRARLRPILMTTLTTVLGLLPMALGLGEGAEIRAPMAITVIVGLTASTVLTLVVVPTLYFQFGGRVAVRPSQAVEIPDGDPLPAPMAK